MKHSWTLLLAVMLGLAHMSLGKEERCYPTGNCYMIHTTALPFEKANRTCDAKGSLTTMKTEQEKREILQFVTEFHTKSNISEFWIGLFQPEKACVVKDKKLYGFIWISGGDDTNVTEWDKVPRKTCLPKKRCVVLKSRSGSTNSGNLDWIWKMHKCSTSLPSICRSSEALDFSPSQDVEIVSHPSTNPYIPSTHQFTENFASTSKINVLCKGFRGNVTFTCTVENISYSCNDTHCFCGQTNDKGGGYGLRSCQNSMNESCLDLCVKSSNISCACTDQQTPCDREECTINNSSSPMLPMSPSTVLHDPRSTSVAVSDDENLFDGLIIPVILGLVALGILVMLVWGGVQMCVRRRRKPKRKKSIAPVEPEASDTDSTDHSSSDEEEEESQDRIEVPL